MSITMAFGNFVLRQLWQKKENKHFKQFKYLSNIATDVFIYNLLSSISLISLRGRLESKKLTTVNC